MAELISGAVVSAVVSELLSAINKAESLTSGFHGYYRSLKSTIESLVLKIEEINQLDEDRATSDNENSFMVVRRQDMSKLVQKLKKGMQLVTECSRMPKWKIWKKYMYSKQLLLLESELHRFTCTNIQADIWRDAKELVLHAECIKEKVNKLETDDRMLEPHDNASETLNISQTSIEADKVVQERSGMIQSSILEKHRLGVEVAEESTEVFTKVLGKEGNLVDNAALTAIDCLSTEAREESAVVRTKVSGEDGSLVDNAAVIERSCLSTEVYDTGDVVEDKNELTNAAGTEKEAIKTISDLEHDLRELDNQLQRIKDQREWLSKICYMFSLPELKKATNDFDAALVIGKGCFGSTVYKGLLRCIPVAIKTFNTEQSQGCTWYKQKVVDLTNIRHPNLVKLIGACPEAQCLVYELHTGGSLEDYLFPRSGVQPLSWRARSRIAAEICSALIFLHSLKPRPVIHGNLKPTNILLDVTLTAKLTDFDIHKLVQRQKLYETIAYMDPQFTSKNNLTVKSDVYAFGVIILQLLTAKPSYDLVKQVKEAVSAKNFQKILDPAAGDWPLGDALRLAELGLQFCQRKNRLRPNLKKDIWLVQQYM